MLKWQKEHIRKNSVVLQEDTVCDQNIFTHLEADDVLAHVDVVGLLAASNLTERNYKFYELIKKKLNSYVPLIKALQNTSQHGPAEILISGIPPDSPLRVELGLTAPPPQIPVNVVAPTPQIPANFEAPTPHVTVNFGVASPTPQIPANFVAQAAPNRPVELDTGGRSPDEVDFTENITPLQISFTRPPVPTSFDNDHYGLSHSFKGFALVLNITKFDNEAHNRNGATKDTTYMKDLWTGLGYMVTPYEGHFTFEQVEQILVNFRAQFSAFSASQKLSCVIFIGSHGSFNKIDTSDGREINLYKHVIYKFDSKNCPALQGRPKIFLIQACQRFQTDDAGPPTNRTDVDSVLPTPIDDAVVSFSTIPGWPANRDLYLGTWYGYCLAKVVMENAWNMDLIKLLEKTQQTMRNINAATSAGQLSAYMHLGIKTLYFNMNP